MDNKQDDKNKKNKSIMNWVIIGVLALIVALMLKAEDKKKGYGLQEANIKK